MARKKKQQINTQLIGWLVMAGIILLIAQDRAGRFYLTCVFILGLSGFIFEKIHLPSKRKERLRLLRMDDVDNMAGPTFAQYVAELLRYRGFKTTLTPARNDYGADIVAERDGTKYAVQCKRHGENISRQAISDAVAGKHHYECTVAMVITNRHFRSGARELANSTRCVLVDRDKLAEWIQDYHQKKKAIGEG